MKLSDLLYSETIDLWKEAAAKPFVKAMAEGTLDGDLFRQYMIQDYLYLLDYIDMLRLMTKYTDDPSLKDFLSTVITETGKETFRVHVPHMKQIGVTDEEIALSIRKPVITEYIEYMRAQILEKGLLAGLTAMLQCSWVYAYIGERTVSEYRDRLRQSPYKFWFDAYTCREYIEANALWIEVLDRTAGEAGPETTAGLCKIFKTCAEYENRFWDSLYTKEA